MTNQVAKKFQRKIEDFICENCGNHVEGNGYTNHCPKCLVGKHVDNFPGDRENLCGGLMDPIDVEVGNDEKVIIFRCRKCGEVRRNRTGDNDNFDRMEEIVKKKQEIYGKN